MNRGSTSCRKATGYHGTRSISSTNGAWSCRPAGGGKPNGKPAGTLAAQKIQVPPDPLPLAPFERGIPENLLESVLRQHLPLGRGEVEDLRQGGKPSRGGGFAEPVPGADVLAGIAPEHPVLEFPLHIPGDQLV